MSMLQQGQIPNTEPTIRVGILLPQDNLRTMTLSLSDPAAFKVSTDRGLLTFTQITQEMIINIKRQSLELSCLPDHPIQIIDISPILNNSKDTYFTVEDVPAGRGFHWEKSIETTFAGEAQIFIKDGALVLVNEIPLEAYLKCVATSEMSAACPLALIEAQTIVARSWLLANVEQKHAYLGFDVCNDDCCQRYQGIGNLTAQAIAGSDHTRGQVLVYEDEICDARYSKSCGGMTERFENIWDGNSNPPKALRTTRGTLKLLIQLMNSGIGIRRATYSKLKMCTVFYCMEILRFLDGGSPKTNASQI